jgi:hypothetical protein
LVIFKFVCTRLLNQNLVFVWIINFTYVRFFIFISLLFFCEIVIFIWGFRKWIYKECFSQKMRILIEYMFFNAFVLSIHLYFLLFVDLAIFL